MKLHLVARISGLLMLLIVCRTSLAKDEPAPSASPEPKSSPSPAPNTSASPAASPSPAPEIEKEKEKEKEAQKQKERQKGAEMEFADFQRICANEFHLPFGRKLVFSLDGTQGYAILPVNATQEDGGGLRKESPKARKLIYFDLQLASGASTPRFGLKNTLNADLVMTLDSHGFASGMAAAILPPAFANCGRGDLELVSGFTDASGPVRRKGFLGIVPSYRVPILYDPVTRNLLQLDTDTMQSRFLAKVPSGSHIIHVDPLGGRLILWDNALRTLTSSVISSGSREVPGASRKLKSIKVKSGYQLLQTGARFAAIKISPAENSITIHEIPAWTGVTKEGEYRLKLPPAYSATQAQVWPNFDRKLALITAKTDDVRRRWQKVFLYDYGSGRLIYEFTAKGLDYFGDVGISPNTKAVVVVGMNGAQSVAEKVVIRDLSKEVTNEFQLTKP